MHLVTIESTRSTKSRVSPPGRDGRNGDDRRFTSAAPLPADCTSSTPCEMAYDEASLCTCMGSRCDNANGTPCSACASAWRRRRPRIACKTVTALAPSGRNRRVFGETGGPGMAVLRCIGGSSGSGLRLGLLIGLLAASIRQVEVRSVKTGTAMFHLPSVSWLYARWVWLIRTLFEPGGVDLPCRLQAAAARIHVHFLPVPVTAIV